MGRVKVWTDMLPSHEFGKTQHCVAGWNLLISFFFFSFLSFYPCYMTILVAVRDYSRTEIHPEVVEHA